MSANISAPRGTKDLTPDEAYKWHFVEKTAISTATDFGFSEIRFPTFEHTELFVRGVGDTTDVVQKEMYTFLDKGGRSLTLRPEGTASVVRSYLENTLFSSGLPVKVFYLSSIFRYDKPQAGRYREHHQFGIECFGPASPDSDCELIALGNEYLTRLGVRNASLEINSIGCPVCRNGYNTALKEYFKPHTSKLCPTCTERLDRNPARLLDCKNEECKAVTADAPSSLDYLCDECSAHFSALRENLDDIGIVYTVNPRIVRGLDYYTKTVFEFVHKGLGAQTAIIGGGRYDGLVEALGGSATPALGFGSGIERMILSLESEGVQIPQQEAVSLFIAAQSAEGGKLAQNLVQQLRQHRVAAVRDLMGRSLKAQMKYANKINAKYCIVIGESEIASGRAEIKNMSNGESTGCVLSTESIKGFLTGLNS